jgi:hypothetical protein
MIPLFLLATPYHNYVLVNKSITPKKKTHSPEQCYTIHMATYDRAMVIFTTEKASDLQHWPNEDHLSEILEFVKTVLVVSQRARKTIIYHCLHVHNKSSDNNFGTQTTNQHENNLQTHQKHGSKSNNKMDSHATGMVDPASQSPPTFGLDKDHGNHANNHTTYQTITYTIAAHVRNIRYHDAYATMARNFVDFLPTSLQEMRTFTCPSSPKQQT